MRIADGARDGDRSSQRGCCYMLMSQQRLNTSVAHNSKTLIKKNCQTPNVNPRNLKSVIYPKSSPSPPPSLMKTRLPSLITLFSLLPRLPSHKADITQLRIRAARLQMTSGRFAQTAHTDNKQCNFKRAPKGNGTDTIRATLIESIINNSMTPHGIREREREHGMIWKHNENILFT